MEPSPTSLSRPWFTPVVLAVVLFCSGMCSLAYQTVWLREFRLLFGGAAPAAAAVIAVFMAGLGFGGSWFGARAERTKLPLKFYTFLECAIALSACLTPFLFKLAKTIYLGTGGAQSMGLFWATVLQISITALVLGVPCFLIGGTLPAAMKFAQRDADEHRSDTALFYGINIAGALTGALLGTFMLLPTLGNRSTLMIAVLVNAGLALAAGLLSRRTEQREPVREQRPVQASTEQLAAQAPSWFVLAAAFLSGFTFFVAELVWYRVSTPLLGSTVYGFGLVLCVVLLGMGMGGVAYSFVIRKLRPTMGGFTLVSALQALFILLPYALGDRLSYGALVINEALRGFGFGPLVGGWSCIIAALVFMPSVLSGIQFPMLVSLLGRGNDGVGRELGRAYFWNTVGSISGSLVGGFMLVPILTATKTWVAIALVIAAISAASIFITRRMAQSMSGAQWISAMGIAACVVIGLYSTGPTAAWLEAPIGYGRVFNYPKTALNLASWERERVRQHVQSFDGRDANVAVVGTNEHSFMTNGKSDGSALNDAPTQVMFGMVGAVLHPRDIEQCCVLGLGTGSTAGWLAQVPSVKKVDVIEIESRAADIARHFSAVNHSAVDHPKVNMIVGDGREVLQTSGKVYDLIASEPSNPYRAGVANLYTTDFYAGVKQRLAPDGVFCQWLQGYETDPSTVRLVVSTLCSEFQKVEVWCTMGGDFVFVCSPKATAWDLATINRRITQAPYAEACARFWHADTAESFASHCMANMVCSQFIALARKAVNTDDFNALEFASAENMGAVFDDPMLDIFSSSAPRKMASPIISPGLDPLQLARARIGAFAQRGDLLDIVVNQAGDLSEVVKRDAKLQSLIQAKNYKVYVTLRGSEPAVNLSTRLYDAIAFANTKDARAPAAIAAVEAKLPGSAPFLLAMQANAANDLKTEVTHLAAAFEQLRTVPWIDPLLLSWFKGRLTSVGIETGRRNPVLASVLFDALKKPLPENLFNDTRRSALTGAAMGLTPAHRLVAAEAWGTHTPFIPVPLVQSVVAYAENNDPRVLQARADLEKWVDLGGDIPVSLRPIASALLECPRGDEALLMETIAKQRTAAAAH